MFQTKNLVHDIKNVPSEWIFEHFLNLKQKLSGQDVRIKSIFNPKEKTESMYIYYKNGKYNWKDFSSGKGGNAIELIKELNNTLPLSKACNLIVQTYNDYVLHNDGGYDVQNFKQTSKYKVCDHVIRGWIKQDQYFWTPFNIGSKLLEEHMVFPLESYTLKNNEGELTIRGSFIYGYFKKDGTLYKIYQPKTKDKKFIKIVDYIQGSEQCIPGMPYLLIVSSLKDIMAVKSLRLSKMNIIAPDSENTMIKPHYFENWETEYKKVILMFDNDDAGIAAMEKYKEKYPYIEVCVLPMSKDQADSVKDFGPLEVRNRIIPIINNKIQIV